MAITVRTEAVADIGSHTKKTITAEHTAITMEHIIIRPSVKAASAIKNNTNCLFKK